MELKASEELLKRLSAQLLQFQDAERNAMAREFNENIAQCLSAVKLRTEAMLQQGEGETPLQMIGTLRLVIEDLETTVAAVREMTKRLSPLGVPPWVWEHGIGGLALKERLKGVMEIQALRNQYR